MALFEFDAGGGSRTHKGPSPRWVLSPVRFASFATPASVLQSLDTRLCDVRCFPRGRLCSGRWKPDNLAGLNRGETFAERRDEGVEILKSVAGSY